MTEIAGLALGVLGIAGLFTSCIANFDIVVRAKKTLVKNLSCNTHWYVAVQYCYYRDLNV
jgi:hypothetical protein